jgi:hypothetical protein
MVPTNGTFGKAVARYRPTYKAGVAVVFKTYRAVFDVFSAGSEAAGDYVPGDHDPGPGQ